MLSKTFFALFIEKEYYVNSLYLSHLSSNLMPEIISDPYTYLRIIFGLFVVISLFMVLSKYLKKYPNFIPTGSGELFNVVKKQAFDSNSTFYLVDTCGKYYLFVQSSGKLEKIDSFSKNQIENLEEFEFLSAKMNKNQKINSPLKKQKQTKTNKEQQKSANIGILC